MNKERLNELLKRNEEIHYNDDCAQNEIWREMFDILSENLNETINYLDNCSKNQFYYICALFEDLSGHFRSLELIECMKRNAERTGVDCGVDIGCAENALKIV